MRTLVRVNLKFKHAYRILAAAALLFFGFKGRLAAQDTAMLWRDYSYVQQANVELQSNNAVFLQHFDFKRMAIAEAYATKSNGGFVNYHQSGNSYELGAQTEAYFRLNPKVVFYGKVRYGNFTGQNMGGSVFINPYYNAFDIVEWADSTRGEKNLERYHLVGAVGIRLYQGLSLGGKVDYQAANYAKYKDLRHTNKLLDMSCTLGLGYAFGSVVELGVSYLYGRSTEGITFKRYGNTDKPYSSLINFGAFYGRTEAIGESGYTKEGASTPVFNKLQGVEGQLRLRLGSRWSMFNSASYTTRNGYYGRKMNNSPLYTEHTGHGMSYLGSLSYTTARRLHNLQLNVGTEQLDNFENIYQENHTLGGKTEYIYYGSTQTTDRKISTYSLRYTANLGVENYHPTWVLTAGAYTWERKQTTSLYPYYRRQNVQTYAAQASAKRNIICGKNEYSLLLGALYGSGSGTAKKDGVYTPPSSTQGAPKSMDVDLYREYEYLTATRLQGKAELGYERLLTAQVRGHLKFSYEYTRAYNVEYVKDGNFGVANLIIGCTF